MELFHKVLDIDFVVKRLKTLLTVSTTLLVLSVASLAVRGLNFGIDFAGGYELQVKFPMALTETQIQEVLAPLGLGETRVQQYGKVEENEHLIMVPEHGTLKASDKDALKAEFETLAGGADNLTNWSVAESGENVVVGFGRSTSEAQVREVFTKRGLQVRTISKTERNDKPDFTVELVGFADIIENRLREGFKIDKGTDIVKRVEFVGPQVGAQLRNQGFLAVLYSMALILVYVAIRFDLFFSPGAVVCLIHDVIITMGVFSVCGFEFNLSVVAAILTLMGYSLNDTIVVYDRIRENVPRLKGKDLRSLVNISINETLSRTLLTGTTTILVVLSLLVFGGGFIRDFSIAMLVGVLVGTYSSIAIASPCYILLRERYEGMRRGPKPTRAAAA